MYIHTHMHTCTHMDVHTFAYIHMLIYTYTHAYVYTRANIHAHVRAHVHNARIYTHTYIPHYCLLSYAWELLLFAAGI